ncbi:DnaQ-like DNA polymerase III subunit [Gordonia phage Skog]|uniref:DnaQ-like DNA polymerase III subunit n=1 Tax=Gordonia phage Skog TaxID=2704033 RepID=A0A6G6XKA8_9CAUD|nr:Rnase H [Gordonia phage Skog]QIG58285.1 DnaQ-like DNA polymerase III subunit [Gordonia phage Skog]
MRYWYDTEFLDDGETIALISIGIVAEDGREYYAVNQDMPVGRIAQDAWLLKNVCSSLPGDMFSSAPWDLDQTHPDVKPKRQIAREVERFLLEPGEPAELWAWYGAYDHVVLAQLWGPMKDLPWGVPMWTNDLRQEVHLHPAPYLPEQTSGHHNALEDARHLKKRWDRLQEWRGEQERLAKRLEERSKF